MIDDDKKITVGAPKESFPGERRVAVVPEVVPLYTKAGFEVSVEAGAGTLSGIPDERYREKGAGILATREELFRSCDMILQVRTVGANPEKGRADFELYRPEQAIVGFFDPLGNAAMIQEVATKGVTSFSIELMPRLTKAQSMDALSSQATVAGYKAVLIAAGISPKMFPLLMTAAGTVSPAHVLIVGAGVAGLQAIATAKRLGAVVSAYDIRPEVKEQIESLGAKFVELEIEESDTGAAGGYAKAMGEEFYNRQRKLMSEVVAKSDIVITTAAVPGKKAPVLIDRTMVSNMSEGSVIVDLAAETGGNCEITKPGQTIEEGGVKIYGPLNVTSTAPYHASQLYARNLFNFVKHLYDNKPLQPGTEDEIMKETMLTHGGKVVNRKVQDLLSSKQTVE